MTPATALAACPDQLLRRRPSQNQQNETARALAAWLLERGCRPSLADVEAERARRAK